MGLVLHDFHRRLGASFGAVNDCEMVSDYGSRLHEYSALRASVGVLDLGFRSRLCLLGADRERLLHGQVTNNVKALRVGQGVYAALVSAKGRLESDLNIYRLQDEFLLDFEPGLTVAVTRRFEGFIIADDVQVVDVAPHYGLLSVQGPLAGEVMAKFLPGAALPAQPFEFAHLRDPTRGDRYVMNQSRTGAPGFDLLVPAAGLEATAAELGEAAGSVGGRWCGWEALELARIEAGIPRFGQDMDATNLAPEAGIEARAISYSKGCYIGQEVIARIRTYGQVAKALRGLRLPDDLPTLPVKGQPLFKDEREVGYVTSAIRSPALNANLALGYVRREHNQAGTELVLKTDAAQYAVKVVSLPFCADSHPEAR